LNTTRDPTSLIHQGFYPNYREAKTRFSVLPFAGHTGRSRLRLLEIRLTPVPKARSGEKQPKQDQHRNPEMVIAL